MGSLIVDKRTLQVLIRSADQARKDLMGFNRSLQEKHLPSPEGFAGKVRDVRRLHDYLGRAGRSPEDRLSLDFALRERILLGSCLHHLKTQVDNDLRVPGVGKSQLRVLEETRTKINFLIAKMHAPGVCLLIKDGQLTLNPTLDIDPDEVTLDIDLTEEAAPLSDVKPKEQFQLFNGSRFAFKDRSSSSDTESGTESETESDTAPDTMPAPEGEAQDSASSSLKLADAKAPTVSSQTDSSQYPVEVSDILDAHADQAASEEEQERSQGPRPKGLFNPRMVKEPKIRTLARLDLQDFNQAKKKLSLRRMFVHLLGCFEALLLDHVIQNLDVYGMDLDKVDEWDFRALTHRVFSGKFDANQLQVLDFLFKARDFLNPARMYNSPRVLTKPMVQSAESLTRWMISELGYDQIQEEHVPANQVTPKLWRSSPR